MILIIGQITFSCPTIRQLKAVQFIEAGQIKRIRGIAYGLSIGLTQATRMSPQMANRQVEAARAILSRFIPDVYLYTDVYKGAESGLSPGYAMSLVAESTTGVLIGTELAYQPKARKEGVTEMLVEEYAFETPEDLGIRCARQLLNEIKKGTIIVNSGGSVDGNSQWIHLLFIALGPEDVGKVVLGSLTPFTYTPY